MVCFHALYVLGASVISRKSIFNDVPVFNSKTTAVYLIHVGYLNINKVCSKKRKIWSYWHHPNLICSKNNCQFIYLFNRVKFPLFCQSYDIKESLPFCYLTVFQILDEEVG